MAINAKSKGAAMLMIVSKDDTYMEDFNVEDHISLRVNLPTIIIKKSDSKLLLTMQNSDDVQISVTFNKPSNEKVQMKLYLKSDDLKALNFFVEFDQYYDTLKDKIEFEPIYRYHECEDCLVNNERKPEPEDACFRDTRFCSFSNKSKF